MTLKVRVGRKGYIILPKAVREAIGIDEGDELIVEVRDVIILRPAKRPVDIEKVRRLLAEHALKIKGIEGRREPTPGEAGTLYLEEEFDD